MKKCLFTLVICFFILPLNSLRGKEFRTLPVSTYLDKMKAGWIGQMAGVGWGGPTEFYWCGEIIPEDKMPIWQPEMINQFQQDDIYVEMTFLRTLEVYGLDVSIRQAGIDFANSGYDLAHANEYGRENLRKGIAPPDSGHPEFTDHADDIDYQIEADYAGLISPGLPNSAIRLGEIFGRLMNYGDGLYGGQFVASMYAEAFFERDMEKVVRAGLKCIPQGSQYHECITDVLNWYHQHPEDWERTWQRIEDKYNLNPKYHRFACNDEENIDAKINGAYIVMGLLYGEGDIDETIIVSTRCGQDSDCNPSNAAGILCTSIGYANIPRRFKSALDPTGKFSHTPYNFDSLVAVCEKLTRQSILRSGGRIEKDASGKEVFIVPNIKVEPSKLEQSWEPGPIANSRYTPAELAKLLLRLKVTESKPGLADATYDNLEPGEFMRKWLALGPMPYPGHNDVKVDDEIEISNEEQRRAFDTDAIDVFHFEPKKKIGNTAYQWAGLETEYNRIDLEAWDEEDIDFKIGYFWAQIEMPQDRTCTLGIGSDDGVKVWLNGELVHENWSIRGVTEDDDRVRVRFKKGKNQLVLKVQNGAGSWGFCCRMLGDAEEFRELSVSTYIDKMKAGWIGQMAGVGWGGPTEFKWNGIIIPADKMPKWQPEKINQFEQDDIYVEMTFLRTLEAYGIDANMRQAGIDFAGSQYLLAHANIAGRGNLREGIAPPDSGHPRFNRHADDIDYQIEADYSGLVSPGLPNEVIRLGEVFGRLMNYGDGLYGGQFIGGMVAEAYFEDDRVKIVEAGLKCIPEKSQYAEMVRDMLAWYAKNPEDWKKTWQRCEEKYHKDARYMHGLCCKPGGENSISIDAKLNGAYVIMGLLYGRGDPDQTIIIATRCGQDSDCNPSSAAGILFTTLGYSNVPERFTSALDAKGKFSHTPYNFDSLVAVCEKLTRQSVLRSGGRIEKKASGEEVFVIPNTKVNPSKLEQSWGPGPIANSRYTPEEMDQMQLKVKLTKGKVGLDDVTYEGLVPGEFMRKWLMLGPIPLRVHYGGDLDDEQQEAAFHKDSIDAANFEPKKEIFDSIYEWSIVEAGPNVIDLLAVSKDDMEAQIAYLWAQIDMPQDEVALLGIGSDDAVKVWLNGELVHENWVERGVVEDEDRVPVHFKKGMNQLVLKIQNTFVDYGFCCRMLDDQTGRKAKRKEKDAQ